MKNARCREWSSHFSSSGQQVIPNSADLQAYLETIEGEIDKLFAIFRWLSLQSYFSLKISLSLRIEIGAVGMVILIIKNEKNNG